MAEGSDSSSIRTMIADGSDFVYEFLCTPCAGDGSRLEAFHFCPTCDQFLCDTCTKYHQRLQRSHQLQPTESMKDTQRQAVTTKQLVVAKCHIHPDRDIEMYCGTHDMVYCLLCIAKEHRSCKNVDEVQDGIHKSNIHRLQQVVADIDRFNYELGKFKRSKSDNLEEMKMKKADLLREIDQLREEMNDHLDQLERKIKAELDEEISKLEQDIRDDIDAVDDLLTAANNRKPDPVSYDSDKHMFIAEKLGRKVVSDVNAFITNSFYRSNIKFKHNEGLHNSINMADSLGKIVKSSSKLQQVKRRQYIVKSCDQRNVKTDTDEESCFIIGMCQLQDGTMLLLDHRNSELKRLDDQLSVKDVYKLKSEPFGLCCVSASAVIVRFADSIQFINVGHTLQLGKNIKINQQNSAYGNSIACCSENVWTIGNECLDVHSTSGTFVKKIDTDSRGQKMFGSSQPYSISANRDQTKVYVTTLGDVSVLVFNNHGDIISKLSDKRLDRPCGICVTEDDIIIVVGHWSQNTLMFDSDCKSIGELVSSKDLLAFPYSVYYDSTNCRLYVGFYVSDTIQVFELSE